MSWNSPGYSVHVSFEFQAEAQISQAETRGGTGASNYEPMFLDGSRGVFSIFKVPGIAVPISPCIIFQNS